MTTDHDTTRPDAIGSLMMPPGYVAALDPDGRLIAVPTGQPATPQAPDATPPAGEPERASTTLPPIVGQLVVLGSITALAGSGALWIAAAALRSVHPVLPDAITCLKWSAILVGFVVAGVFTAKVRSRTGATLSVFHTTKTTSIGTQTVRGRGNHGITNHL